MGPRIGAVAAILAVLSLGIWLSGKLERDSRERVALLQSEQTDATAVREDVAERREDERFSNELFDEAVSADATEYGIEEFAAGELGQKQVYRVLIEDPVTLSPGRSWSSGPLRVKATVEKVSYQKHGATIAAKHSIAIIDNVGERPIAYYARLRSAERGHCDVRGARMHNAMALMPKETAEIVVCAGGGNVRVDRLEILEISQLGYYYLSRVPPATVGYDGISSGSHRPLQRVSMCQTVDARGVGGQIRQGLTRWVDVVDFYSRHNCDRFRFFPGYRYEDGPRTLPARPPA